MPAIRGQIRRVSLLRWDRESCCLKMSQASFGLSGDTHMSSPYSETLPAWVMWDGQELYRLVMSEPLTGGTAGGVWPTPKQSDTEHAGPNMRGSKGEMMLPSAAMAWATPTSRDSKGKDIPNRQGSHSLSHQAPRSGIDGPKSLDYIPNSRQQWATPTGKTPEHSTRYKQGGIPLQAQVKGRRLNPTFVEWLMNYPIGASDLSPLDADAWRHWVTASYQQQRRSFSGG